MKGLTLNCIVTNRGKYVGGSVLQNKVNKFGSEDNIRKFYVSREAAQLLKQGYTVEQVRSELNVTDFNKTVDFEVLYKLKLLKKRKRKPGQTPEDIRASQELSEKNTREWYFQQEKMKSCKKTWVEEMTGGKNRCQVAYGGTCIRPDIYYNHEYNKAGRCSPCPHNEHCLCRSKEVV
jgi:hypothetical protein